MRRRTGWIMPCSRMYHWISEMGWIASSTGTDRTWPHGSGYPMSMMLIGDDTISLLAQNILMQSHCIMLLYVVFVILQNASSLRIHKISMLRAAAVGLR